MADLLDAVRVFEMAALLEVELVASLVVSWVGLTAAKSVVSMAAK